GDCAQAIYQSWGVIGLGLSAFALSSFTPTQRFGYLMFAMLTASSFGNLVLLPALLASPLAHFFWKSGEKIATRKRSRGEVHPAPELHPHLVADREEEPAGELVAVGAELEPSELVGLSAKGNLGAEKVSQRYGSASKPTSRPRLPRRPR
ncbi:MAG: hypothetical protein ACPLRM_05760, partial [Anaerolineae bacterium]